MADYLIINEKPSVSRSFAKALRIKESSRHDGYIEGYSPVLEANVQVTWCVGHLVTLSYPEAYDARLKQWNEEDLPFLPDEYRYEVIKDVKKQFGVVKTLLNGIGKSDTTVPECRIYWAGDSGREGAYIGNLVRRQAGFNHKAKELMVWIDSQTDEAIINGIKDARPYSEYAALISSGYERAVEDYAVGINFSRILSIRYGREANRNAGTKKYRPVSVGRVMTCVLGMIVQREKEIEDFVPTKFHKILNTINGVEAEWHADEGSRYYGSPDIYSNNGFLDQAKAEAFIRALPENVVIKDIEKKTEKKYAPLLFNLAELQAECSRRFKISPDKTLEIAQTLYEKQMTTYPRTDARVLSSAVAKEIGYKNGPIQGLAGYGDREIQAAVEHILRDRTYSGIEKTKYTDDSKITDHYAIIPTGKGLDNAGTLSEIERNVFDIIVRRFVSIFLPPAEYSTVKMTEDAGGETFYVSSKVLSSPGYLAVAGIPNTDRNVDPDALGMFVKGGSYPASYSTRAGETAPPKRYTSGSMVLAMENAGNLIEDEELRAQIRSTGIGTSATRAETIKKLTKLEYIKLNSKTQVLTPMQMGLAVYEICKRSVPELLNPRMTASWEKGLENIVQGTTSPATYRQTLNSYVAKVVSRVKEKSTPEEKSSVPEPCGIACPACGQELKCNERYFKCDCGFYSPRAICGHNISKSELESVAAAGKTGLITDFISKKGKAFSAVLVLEDGKLNFAFPDAANATDSGIMCPACRKEKLRMGDKQYFCGCGFRAFRTAFGHEVTKEDMESLYDNGMFKADDFVSKAGKRYSAAMKLKSGSLVLDFNADVPGSGIKCPCCKDDELKEDQWKYSCTCGFAVRKTIAGRNLSKEEITTLCKKGSTELLDGFMSKTGSTFSCKLKVDRKNRNVAFSFPKKK